MKRTVNKYHMWWFKGENTQRRLKSNLLNVVFEFWIWKGGGGGGVILKVLNFGVKNL